jgi:LuxR family maltose regulon positive regulatory protein
MAEQATFDDPYALLSPRELAVLDLIADGLTNGEAAGRLGVTVYAVKFHLGSIYRKLGVSNRTEAAVRYSERRRHVAGAVDYGEH